MLLGSLLPCYTNYYYYKSETENSDCVLLVLIEYLQKGHCKEHQQSQHVMSSVLAGTPRFRANKRCESHQKSQDISSSATLLLKQSVSLKSLLVMKVLR